MDEPAVLRALNELLDREAIRDCLMRYCHAIDRCDEQMLRGVYWPEAIDEHGMFNGPASEYVDMVMPMLRTMEATVHTVSNMWIELQGDQARVETYMSAYHRAASRDGVMRDSIIAGRYLDRMEKRDGEWRILHRLVVVDWLRQYPDSGDLTKTRVISTMKPAARKPDDPYYSFFGLTSADVA
jgi:hypothetical protein